MATPPATPKEPTGSPLRRNAIVIVVVVILVAFVGLVAITNLHVLGGGRTSVIKPAGTEWSVPAGSYEVLGFTLSSSASIGGSIQGSNGVVVYVMTPSAYQVFAASGTATGAAWTSGPITSSSISFSLDSGTWYMVFGCPQIGEPTQVVLTSDLVATSN